MNFNLDWVKSDGNFSSKELVKTLKEKNIWPGYGVCCENFKKGRCFKHGRSYVEGIPLYYYGRFVENWDDPETDWKRRNISPRKIHYYELWQSCHFIAFFIKTLASKVFPDKKWLILWGENHTVIVDSHYSIVMDFLNYRNRSSTWSMNFALENDPLLANKYFIGKEKDRVG